MTTISSNPALKQRLEEKFEKIKHDICKPWSEKISKALFTFSKKQKELEDIYKQVSDATSKERIDEETEGTTVAASSATTVAVTSASAEPAAPSTNEQKPAETTPSPETPPSESSPSENSEPAIQPLAPESQPVEPKPTEDIIERIISVEVDWASFNDLFDSLYREGAGEVIDTIIESLISKDCAISLLSSLLEHCRPPGGESYKVSKHEQIRAFLQQGLKRYVIKYSDDPREWGFFKDGTLCDVVEIDVTDDEEINWIFRDVTKNIEKSTHLQQFIVSKYLIPQFRLKIYNVLYANVALDIDWISIDYAAADYAKAVYTIYHDSSLFVLDEVYRAFEWIAMYEPDELVDAIVHGIKRVVIALQPGHDYTRKDFDINDKTKTLTLRLCLEADEFAGVFRSKDLIPIIKVAGLYANKFTSIFKFELLSAAAAIYKLPRGDLGLFQNILNRKELWAVLNEKETKSLDICKKFIDKYYKERMGHEAERAEGEDEDEDEEYEKIIKGWHIIKFNKRNLHQERYLVLTNRAYWTFKCEKGKVDSKHFKRHDLLDFYLAELGTLEETAEAAIFALKMYTREKRKGSIIPFGEEKREGGKTVVSTELRKSLRLKPSTSNDLNTLKQQLAGMDFDSVKPARVKKQKPPREKPNVDGCYNSVIIPYVKEGQELDPIEIKSFLTEIALCFFAAASARQRNKITEPVLDAGALLVPKGNWMSFLHNVVGLGMNRKFNFRLGSNKKNEKPEKAKTETKTKKPEEAAATPSKSAEVVLHTPNGSKKAAKPILKHPSTPLEDLSTSAKPEEKEGAEINVTVCSHNRRVVFRPEVQVFYHETDEGADEGGEDD